MPRQDELDGMPVKPTAVNISGTQDLHIDPADPLEVGDLMRFSVTATVRKVGEQHLGKGEVGPFANAQIDTVSRVKREHPGPEAVEDEPADDA